MGKENRRAIYDRSLASYRGYLKRDAAANINILFLDKSRKIREEKFSSSNDHSFWPLFFLSTAIGTYNGPVRTYVYTYSVYGEGRRT